MIARSSDLSQRRKPLAAALLLVQALALIHLGTVTHVIDPATGAVTHAVPEQPNRAPAQPDPQSRPEECVVYTALSHASPASAASPQPALLPTGTTCVPPPARREHPWQRELHRLSPSHSPPATV